MHLSLVKGRPLGAGVVALIIGVVSSATCLVGSIDVRGSQHACCAAMADGCGSAATVTQDCCVAEQPGLTAFAPVPPFTLAAPAAISAVLLAAPTSIPQLASPAIDPDASNPISPPTYLLDSVFRI